MNLEDASRTYDICKALGPNTKINTHRGQRREVEWVGYALNY